MTPWIPSRVYEAWIMYLGMNIPPRGHRRTAIVDPRPETRKPAAAPAYGAPSTARSAASAMTGSPVAFGGR
jgi:hypothetical protein